mmetsp:Transcript_27970/g.43464  ORF Transcript_27970/g.43464 Transcript_27970/m.43464 type:complete len:287 (-) Transcript_27970:32-892(-)|eukprot:CAMPEP_0196814156 /NCGR_PEP_ID=MMETSP1362-20130617/41669_1 /TAXON_ID=163516 /ORGANISM="Leptocylindrus danicus, Strain CCMP1856" /LENGTH=286 /DNA_ID=CAMNT_0042190685 /DNA_START=10 /DNA_END=870 /DNA_ORIENTATION=-
MAETTAIETTPVTNNKVSCITSTTPLSAKTSQLLASSSKVKSEFHNYVDTVVPNHLKRMELTATLRSEDFIQQVAAIEDRQSTWEAKLAKHTLSVNTAYDDLARDTRMRLQTCADDLLGMLHFSSSKLADDVTELEKKTRKLFDEDYENLKRHHFEAELKPAMEEMSQAIQTESSKASREEGLLVRKFEALAGDTSRIISQEVAAMKASMYIAGEEREKDDEAERKKDYLDDMLEELRALRLLMDAEWHERENSDEAVADYFLHSQRTFQKQLLEHMDEMNYIENS